MKPALEIHEWMQKLAERHNVDLIRTIEAALENVPSKEFSFSTIRVNPGLASSPFVRYMPEDNSLNLYLLSLYFADFGKPEERDLKLEYIFTHEFSEATLMKPSNLEVGFHGFMQNLGGFKPLVTAQYYRTNYSKETTILDAQHACSDVAADMPIIARPKLRAGLLLAHETPYYLDKARLDTDSDFEKFSIIVSAARRAVLAKELREKDWLEEDNLGQYKAIASKFVTLYHNRLNGPHEVLEELRSPKPAWRKIHDSIWKHLEGNVTR